MGRFCPCWGGEARNSVSPVRERWQGLFSAGGVDVTFQLKLVLPTWPLSVALSTTAYGLPSPAVAPTVPEIAPVVASMERPVGH